MTESYKGFNKDKSLNYYFHLITNILTIVGALNCGLVGINGFDLIAYLFGHMSTLARIVYIAVGIAGISLLGSLLNRGLNK